MREGRGGYSLSANFLVLKLITPMVDKDDIFSSVHRMLIFICLREILETKKYFTQPPWDTPF